MIARFYDKIVSIEKIRQFCETSRLGSNISYLCDATEKLNFKSLPVRINLVDLKGAPLPCILFWNQKHYVVLYKVNKNRFYIADPAHGLLTYKKTEFLNFWMGENQSEKSDSGIAILLEPNNQFFADKGNDTRVDLGMSFLSPYILKHKKFIFQLVWGLMASSILQLAFPFLTQSIVDVGINNQNLDFVYLVLFAQLSLFVGRTVIETIRSWILLHLSARINISLVSDFFIKLMKLPISYFDTRMAGDILQRINDHKRIQRILTTSSLNVLFSFISFVIFSIVLLVYNTLIFSVFVFGSILYFVWISFFLSKRRTLDYKRFSQISKEQSKVIELINGMQTIKLHNAEKMKRWDWELQQVKLFKISIENLSLEQYQNIGSSFINELKNILITVLSAKLVIQGDITLGMMLAISYIVGQLNSPISQMLTFLRELQDARISLDRLSEIHQKQNEEEYSKEKVTSIDFNLHFEIKELSFRYLGTSNIVLDNLNLRIPAKKITAIVGPSGSGKTTLMKILLKFYTPNKGEVILGNTKLKNLSQEVWRNNCGVVMQEDFIFSDSIRNNIAVGERHVDENRLKYSVEVANIKEFIERLPQEYNTKIGIEGTGLSTGQKQRLLIARAVYKNPHYLFLDEATSSLDANNERVIMDKLNDFFQNRTVVVIAHRLSTVRNAHQIVVLDKGSIVELGNHKELVQLKGEYYNLIKNQLELGS